MASDGLYFTSTAVVYFLMLKQLFSSFSVINNYKTQKTTRSNINNEKWKTKRTSIRYHRNNLKQICIPGWIIRRHLGYPRSDCNKRSKSFSLSLDGARVWSPDLLLPSLAHYQLNCPDWIIFVWITHTEIVILTKINKRVSVIQRFIQDLTHRVELILNIIMEVQTLLNISCTLWHSFV